MNLANNLDYTAILTSFNAEETIKAALESILNQNIPPREIVIVDDCSTDNTNIILDSISELQNIRIIKNQTNQGQSYSRNLAVEISSCDYAIIFDDDDVSLPERAQFHSEMFRLGSVINFVSSIKKYTNGTLIVNQNSDTCFQSVSKADALKKILLGGDINGISKLNIPASTCAFTVSHIKSLGGYDTKFRRLEDADLFIRASAQNLPISWSSQIGVTRHASFSPDKGGSIETDFEALLLSKHDDFLSPHDLKKCSFQIQLRRHYFDRNYSQIAKLLIKNPFLAITNVRKVQGFARRVLHDLRISGAT
jgi:glycosyltransferase involved in cell wall biosynthesis